MNICPDLFARDVGFGVQQVPSVQRSNPQKIFEKNFGKEEPRYTARTKSVGPSQGFAKIDEKKVRIEEMGVHRMASRIKRIEESRYVVIPFAPQYKSCEQSKESLSSLNSSGERLNIDLAHKKRGFSADHHTHDELIRTIHSLRCNVNFWQIRAIHKARAQRAQQQILKQRERELYVLREENTITRRRELYTNATNAQLFTKLGVSYRTINQLEARVQQLEARIKKLTASGCIQQSNKLGGAQLFQHAPVASQGDLDFIN